MLLKFHKLDFMCAIWCHLPSIYIHLPSIYCVEEHPHDAVCERRELGQVFWILMRLWRELVERLKSINGMQRT